MTPREQAHFRILTLLKEDPSLTQQELAARLGVSVGKTNYLIKALVDKGLIKMANFQRSDTKFSKVAYLLTPRGISERLRLTQGYLARKQAEYEALKAEIGFLRREASSAPPERGRA